MNGQVRRSAVAFWTCAVAGCIDPSPYAESPVITSNVEDWRDEFVYQLMVDRFENGDINNDYNVTHNDEVLSRYLGGDYQGIIDRVDYLEALGVTAVWVSPIVANVEEDAGVSSYHGYWTQDFKGVNPHFGDLAKFRELVAVLHEREIKVILDVVVNHVGQLFYYDINRNGQPDTTVYGAGSQDSEDEFWGDPIEVVTEWDPAYDERGVQGWTSLGESGPAPLGWVYLPEINRLPPEPASFQNPDWYNKRGRVTDWNVFEQVVKGDFPGGLKDLDTTHPDVVAALIDAFSYWITETDIDGFRIDTVKHVEHSFWQQFNPAIREHASSLGKENFLQFGEVFDGDDELIGSYSFDEELDSLFYFAQKWQVFDDVFKYGGPTKKIETLYELRGTNYGDVAHEGGIGVPPQQALVNFLDNHDIPRFRFDNSDERALKAALVYLMTEEGIPCLYYGTEQGFSGGNDPANREPLWTSDFATDGDLFEHVSGLARLRKTYRVLRRGDFTLRWVTERVGDEEDAGMLAFERSDGDDRALVVIHVGEGTSSTSFGGASMPTGFAPGTSLEAVHPIGADGVAVDGSGDVVVTLGPYEWVVLVPEDQVVPLVE